MRQQPVALFATLINSALLFVVLKDETSPAVLGAWIAAIWSVTAVRGLIWLRNRGAGIEPGAAERIGKYFTVAALGAGLLWGLPGILFFPENPIALQGFIVFVLGGTSAGAVATMAPHLPAFCGFVTLTLLPVIGQLLHCSLKGGPGSTAYFAMGIMGLIYLLGLLATGRNLNQMLSRSLALQIENGDLAEILAVAQAEAEAASIAKSEFLASVSHELRTPLNAVLGFSQLLGDQVHGTLGHTRYREYVGHIRYSGQHLMRLIEDLLTLTTARSGRLRLSEDEIKDLGTFVYQCLALVEIHAAEKNLGLTLVQDQGDIVLWADPLRLQQVVVSILSNAIKFTPAGGEVALAIERDEEGGLGIVVKDTGIGMTDRELKVALEHFGRADSSYTRSSEGAGIGLPLAATLMRLHQGGIEIDSRPGEGTRVNLRFPAERVIERPSLAPAERVPQGKTGSDPVTAA